VKDRHRQKRVQKTNTSRPARARKTEKASHSFKMFVRKLKRHLFIVVLLAITKLVSSAPKSWPYMKSYDIWGSGSNNTIEQKPQKFRALYSDSKLENAAVGGGEMAKNGRRKAKGR
jgi:cell division septal protein FtsQ